MFMMVQIHTPDLVIKIIFLKFNSKTLYFSYPNNNVPLIRKAKTKNNLLSATIT